MNGILRGLLLLVFVISPLMAGDWPNSIFGWGVVVGAVPGLVLALLFFFMWRRTRGTSIVASSLQFPVTSTPNLSPKEATKQQEKERTTAVLVRQGLPAARLGSWEHDLVNDRLSWFERIHELFGRSPDNMPVTFASLRETVHQGDRELFDQQIKNLCTTGLPIACDVRIIWPDATIHWHTMRAELVRNSDDVPIRIAAVSIDITEHKRVEEELRQTQRLKRVGFEAANVGAWEWDKSTGVMRWSSQVDVLFGLAPGTFDRTFNGYLALIHPDDLSAVQAAIDRSIHEGIGFRVEHRVRMAGGDVRWLAARGDVVRSTEGAVVGMAGVVLDVTSRRMTEKVLRDREERYRKVFSSMHEGVMVYGSDGEIVDCNNSAERIFGLSREQIVGWEQVGSSWRAIHEDGSEVPSDQYPNLRALRTGKSQHGILMGIYRPDQSLRWLVFNADPLLPLNGGAPLGAVVTFNDITERRVAERALRDSEQRWRSLAENVPDTIVLVDRTGTVLFINRPIEGTDSTSVLGSHISAVMPPGFATLFSTVTEQVFTQGEVVSSDLQECGSGQQSRWYSCHISPVRLHGRTIAATLRASDITERRQAENERLKFESERETMFERMPIGCILWSRERRIAYANPAAEQIFGFAPDGMNGFGPELISFEESIADVTSYFERIEKGDMGLIAEMENRKADGSEVRCEWHPTPLFSAAGELTGIITMVMDISQRLMLEEQLRQSQKMEAVGRLAGGIAHDFNNLLTAIMGYGELLESRIPVEDQSATYVQQIKKAAKRAASLTYQLLAFSRKQVQQAKLLVVGEVITDLEPMLRRLIGEHIVLKTDLADNSWKILADAGQLEQVVVNLVVNARDAMPTGGALTITTRNCHLDQEMVRAYAEVPPGDYVTIVVSDTGEGMEDNIRRRIFEPFFTTKPEGKGTGLGLAVVFGVVRQSGGFIFVDSVPTKGSRFEIMLPRADKSPEPLFRSDSTAHMTVRGSETILLVEDDQDVRGLVKDTLESSGYTVFAVSSGQEAVEISSRYQQDIDLLLTDVVMPGLGGREVSEQLRQQRPTIKVLFMSGYTDDLVLTHGVADGSAAFIEKPFSAPKLLGRIRKVLSGKVKAAEKA